MRQKRKVTTDGFILRKAGGHVTSSSNVSMAFPGTSNLHLLKGDQQTDRRTSTDN